MNVKLNEIKQKVLNEAGAGYDKDSMSYAIDEVLWILGEALEDEGLDMYESARRAAISELYQPIPKLSQDIIRSRLLREIGKHLIDDPIEDIKKPLMRGGIGTLGKGGDLYLSITHRGTCNDQ